MSDIGQITQCLRSDAKSIYDTWLRMPLRRDEFGPRELMDIRETTLALQILLREIDKVKKPATPDLLVIGNH